MITEETIKQTNFYRGIDEKVYLVSNVEDVKLVTLIDTIESAESVLILGDDVCSQFEPVLPEFRDFVENQIVPARPVPAENRKEPSRTSKSNARGRGSNKFKGVKLIKPYKDGRKRFSANYFDKQANKVKYIGTFDNEYLAAAAVEEKLGNKAEAARLRALIAEHKDLNTDRPTLRKNSNRSKSKKMVWVCKRCGTQYRTDPSKSAIVPCGHNDGFREVPAEN